MDDVVRDEDVVNGRSCLCGQEIVPRRQGLKRARGGHSNGGRKNSFEKQQHIYVNNSILQEGKKKNYLKTASCIGLTC